MNYRVILIGCLSFLFLASFVSSGVVAILPYSCPNSSFSMWLRVVGVFFLVCALFLTLSYFSDLIMQWKDSCAVFACRGVSLFFLFSFLLLLFISAIVGAMLFGSQVCIGYTHNITIAMTVLCFCLPIMFVVVFLFLFDYEK